MTIPKEYFYRKVKIFDEKDLQIGQVVLYLYEPDCFNWKKCKEKKYRVLT